MDRFLFLFFVLFFGAILQAQELIILESDSGLPVSRAPVETLGEIVLSVTKGKEKRNRIAEQIAVFSKRDIEKISPQTTADLLAVSPGVKVQKSQLGGGSPILRGMEANRVLLVVDGVRMNNAIYRKGHIHNSITVTPSVLDRVEVLFGPSSVVYGSDALGGVIHYYTKTLKTTASKEARSSFFSRFSSVNNEFTNHFDSELSFRKWAAYTSFSYANFGDLKMGKNRAHGFQDWGKVYEYSNNSKTTNNEKTLVNSDPNIQKNTGYSQKDFLQKIYLPISNNVNLLFNFQHSVSSDIPRFDKLTEKKNDTLKFAEWFYGPQKRTLFSTQLLLEEVYNWIDKGTFTMAFQDVGESRIQRKYSSIFQRIYRKEKVKVFSLNGDFSVGLAQEKKRNLSYGFELVYNKVNSHSQGDYLEIDNETNTIKGVPNHFNVQTRYPDGGSSYFSQAAYLVYLQDLGLKHTLNTGIRLTNSQLNAVWADATFIKLPKSKIFLKNTALTATIGHIYKPTKSCKISAVLSSGFRSPNIDDIGKIREKNGWVSVPNVSLKPEYAYTSEVGILQYFNNRLFNLDLNVYYTLLSNYIIRAPFDIETQVEGISTITYDGEENLDVLANVNRGKAYITGGTFSFQGEIKSHYFIKGTATYTQGKTYDTKEPLSSIPPLFGHLEISYKKQKIEIRCNFEFSAEKKVKDYNVTEGIDNIEQTPLLENGKYAGTPSWETFDFSGVYELNRHIDVAFKIDNIFDRHYKEFASGISSGGRNYVASIKYLF